MSDGLSMRNAMRIAKTFSGAMILAALPAAVQGQVVSGVQLSTNNLQVQMTLDQLSYFPGEAAAIGISVTNSSGSQQTVLAPFSSDTGCLVVFTQAPNAPPTALGADTTCNPFVSPLGSPISFPTTTMAAAEQRQITLNSYDNMFDSGIPAMGTPGVPQQPGSYSLNYFRYSSAQALFNVVVPQLDTAAVLQVQDESSFDPASGETTQLHSYMHLFSLRWNNQSYICVTVTSVAGNRVITPDACGNFTSAPGVFRRIATSQNPVTSISATANGSGNLAIQWQDSTGAMFTGSYTTQYGLSTAASPDGSGNVLPNDSYYAPGTTVNLTAIPAPGYTFSGWTGDPVANAASASTTISMTNEFAVTASFTANGQTTPVNISTQVSVTSTGNAYSRPLQLFEGALTVTNISTSALSGPISIVLGNVNSSITIVNATGMYNGSPYFQLFPHGLMQPGTSFTVFYEFSNPSNAPLQWTTATYSGL
jgi:uncharacterized repeat protein (TIGR02543 family)